MRHGIGRDVFGELRNSTQLNNGAFNEYFLKLMDMLLVRFTYKNVPDSMDIRYLELKLITEGSAIVFKDEYAGLMGMGTSYQGVLDQYGVPSERQAISANGVPFFNLDESNSVMIFNNRMRAPDIQLVLLYAQRLWDIQRSIETNCKLQKFSGVAITTQDKLLSMKNALNKWDGNQPFMIATKDFDIDAFKGMGFEIPFVADKLLQVKREMFSEALSNFGIIYSTNDKRERMNVMETASPFGHVEMVRNSYLTARQEGIEWVNKMFGTNITVEFNSNIPIIIPNLTNSENEDGDEYE